MKKLIERYKERRRIVKAMRAQYGYIPSVLALEWYREDQAFAGLAMAMLDASARGVDTSFLRSCPDLHALAQERR